MLEKDLWIKTRKGVGAKWRASRLEDKLSAGIPDVFFTLPSDDIRIAGMIELKCQEQGARGGIFAAHYTQDQRDFALLHESVLLWLHSSGWYMLFPSDVADDILRGQSLDWHKEKALYSSQSPDWTVFIGIVRSYLLGLPQHQI